MRRVATAGGMLAASLWVAGCAAGVDVTVEHAGTPDATLPAGLPSVDPGATPFSPPPAPPAAEIAGLRLTALDPGGAAGAATPLGDLRGARATVVAFWATWCVPCQDEVPALAALGPALARQGVRLLLVDEKEDAATVGSWLRGRGLPAAAWLDPEGATETALVGTYVMPATALLRSDGGVVDRVLGPAQVGPLRADLAAMGISAQ